MTRATVRILFAFLGAMGLCTASQAATVTSTPGGGTWTTPTTWTGGVVPGVTDDVVITGPVQLGADAACQSLGVDPSGELTAAMNTFPRLSVAGSVSNQGTIDSGSGLLRIEIGNGLSNHGTWIVWETTLTGSLDHPISAAPGVLLETHLSLDGAGATGDLLVSTPLAVRGNIDLGSGRMQLLPNSSLALQFGAFSGNILAAGNEIILDPSSYLSAGVFDQVVLAGTAGVTSLSSFTGGLTVTGILQNLPTFGSVNISIEGGLTNLGLIRNNTYGLSINLSGNLICPGTIACSLVSLDGAAPHHLNMAPGGDIGTGLFLPEFGNGTLIVETPATISGWISLGIQGQMMLQPGASLEFTGGSLGGGTLFCGGQEIRMTTAGALSAIQVDDAQLAGSIQVSSGAHFTGGLINHGTLQNQQWGHEESTVDGAFVNHGDIRDNVERSLALRLRGDVTNLGTWHNDRVILDGSADQTIDIGSGIQTNQFVLESGIVSTSYQWFRDGSPLPGETSPQLTFTSAGPAETGQYQCLGGSGETSRFIDIVEGAVAGAPHDGALDAGPAAGVVFGGVHPNPVHRSQSATAHFALPAAASIELTAYSVSGRRTTTLLEGTRPAGRHTALLRLRDLSPGIYFLRLTALGQTHTQRTVILE